MTYFPYPTSPLFDAHADVEPIRILDEVYLAKTIGMGLSYNRHHFFMQKSMVGLLFMEAVSETVVKL